MSARTSGALAAASASTRLDRGELLRDLRERAFAHRQEGLQTVGVEVELLPVEADTGRVLPLETRRGLSTFSFLAEHGGARGWTADGSTGRAPAFRPPEGGLISFEPGGQLEYSSPALFRVDDLVELLDEVVPPLVEAGRERGVDFVCRGLDPVNPVSRARLQVVDERYSRQSEHYDRRGDWGRRMMRQSAAIHVNLDPGPFWESTWEVANRAAPLWTAVFANSPRMEGRESGHRSARAAQWRSLDPTRTAVFSHGRDPAEAYLDFALGAESFLEGPPGAPPEPFESWRARGAGIEAWSRHLTTLFPEVRPRGYLELRSFDALDPRWYAVPLVLAVGLLYDDEARECALEVLAPATPERLERAGRLGLRDADLCGAARDMVALALEGARRLGPVVGGRSLDIARSFVEAFTARGRDPGDEPGDRARRS